MNQGAPPQQEMPSPGEGTAPQQDMEGLQRGVQCQRSGFSLRGSTHKGWGDAPRGARRGRPGALTSHLEHGESSHLPLPVGGGADVDPCVLWLGGGNAQDVALHVGTLGKVSFQLEHRVPPGHPVSFCSCRPGPPATSTEPCSRRPPNPLSCQPPRHCQPVLFLSPRKSPTLSSPEGLQPPAGLPLSR